MGSTQTKENVIIKENSVNVAQVDNKLNIIGIVMIVTTVLVAMLLIYAGKQRCIKGIRKWLKKEVMASATALPSIKVETIQPPQISSNPKVVY